MAVANHLDEEFVPDAMPVDAPIPITESPRKRKVNQARSLGRPFAEGTVATWAERGRQYLTGASEMRRLNSSWDLALADEDVELLGRLLEQAEGICGGGMYDVEAVFAEGQDLTEKARPGRPGDA